jgi:transposase InsO family protein
MTGLVRYVVLFVMKLKTRTVEIAGITRQPDANWMTQVARNLTDAEDGFLRGVHYLILDRDPLYTIAFRDRLRDSGVTPLLLPARSPNLNAFAERSDGFDGDEQSQEPDGLCRERLGPSGFSERLQTHRRYTRGYASVSGEASVSWLNTCGVPAKMALTLTRSPTTTSSSSRRRRT